MQTQAIPLHCNTDAEPAHYDLVYKLTQLSELTSCNYTLVKNGKHAHGRKVASGNLVVQKKSRTKRLGQTQRLYTLSEKPLQDLSAY